MSIKTIKCLICAVVLGLLVTGVAGTAAPHMAAADMVTIVK